MFRPLACLLAVAFQGFRHGLFPFSALPGLNPRPLPLEDCWWSWWTTFLPVLPIAACFARCQMIPQNSDGNAIKHNRRNKRFVLGGVRSGEKCLVLGTWAPCVVKPLLPFAPSLPFLLPSSSSTAATWAGLACSTGHTWPVRSCCLWIGWGRSTPPTGKGVGQHLGLQAEHSPLDYNSCIHYLQFLRCRGLE